MLAGLASAIIAPVGLVAAFIVSATWQQQKVNVDRQNVEMARAVSIAIDQEIQHTIGALQLIAATQVFDGPAAIGFDELARRLVPSAPGWHALLVADSRGEPLLNMSDGPTDIGARPDPDWARDVVTTGRPSVSNIIQRAAVPGAFVVISVPVRRAGEVPYVLGIQIRTERLTRVLERQQIPPDGVITLIDRSKRILARTRNEDTYRGRLPSKGFLEAADRMSEGSWRGERLLEGMTAYAALSRSGLTGWTIGVGLPSSAIDGPMRRALWALLGVSILALAAAGALAVWFSRTFERSFSIASWTAMALARGEPALLPRSRIREVNVLGNGLRAAATTLKARLEERDQAERLKDEFLMTLSHELRTPLTAITGWARMLATGQIRPGQEVRAVASIDRNAGALTQLVDDLLDVSRSVSGKLRLDLRPTEVVTFLQAAIDTVRPAAAAKGIEIETSLDPAAVSVLGDANRLRQIVWNLMSNAVKFTPAGGAVRVTVTRLDPVAPATGQAKAGSHIQSRSPIVEILVTDTGPGIDAALMPFIFDRFRQGSAGSARPPHGGLGLGLAIVRQFVELHGGTAECWNNDPPPGATFRILLPVGTLERRTALAVPGAWQGGPFRDVARSSTRLDGVGVLVVDDDPEAREQFASILELAGAEVRAATQVDDAISLLHMWSPAVVVTDVEMPDDGYALLQRLIGMPAPRPRAVAVTAHADHEAKKRVLGAGFDAHVEQPIDPAAFVALISTLSSTAPAADVH